MAGSVNEEYERSSDETLGEQRCMSGEALAEWRSCEQVENGTPSTSPPFWDTDDDDDDYECGTKPSDLYGKFTWKIENFSQISKRELRSNAFEVGGYKWYILIYPQGCDVCNHLSLFLCVANHDKLLPGWSHFAQFTIAVVNKDPKKSKYSDTLHRFWKKEHDWGWKKFMELSKVLDGFISSDTLVIKAQVQVIREKPDRPFRCLDCQYRRELVRVYLTNVEQICRRFVEERRGKLVKLIEDKARWSSFCAFWSEIDQGARRHMSREKTDAILRIVVKHFFIEKEVTSTLVMDSLHSGLRVLEWQSRCKNERAKLLDIEEPPAPIVRMENDMFVLADDVLVLLQRASLEPLPPKDEKGPQNRTKDGNSGEDFNKDSIERDERRLTELGRRTVEIFVLAHIFSNRIEVAHQEAVALKKQEELIREEEAAGQAESEQKSKRGGADKDKRAKKKQSKHRRTSRKVKDKGKDEKSYVSVQDKEQGMIPSDVATVVDSAKQAQSLPEKPGTPDDASNATDSGDEISEMLQQEPEERNASIVSWDTDASEAHLVIETNCSGISSIPVPNGQVERKSTSVMDDSSSTCSTDSVLSVALNGNYITNSLPHGKSQKSPSRGKKQRAKEKRDQTVCANDTENQSVELLTGQGNQYNASQSCTATGSESEPVVSLKDRLEQHSHEKQEVVMLQKKPNVKDQVDVDRPSKQMMAAEALSSLSSPTKNARSIVQRKLAVEDTIRAHPILPSERSSNNLQKTERAISSKIASIQTPATSKSNVQNAAAASKCNPSKTEKSTSHQVPAMSRPSSAPIIPAPRPSAPVVSMVQTAPSLARSVSAVGRLGPDPSPATHSYVPPSYRNAIMGKSMGANPSGFGHCPPSSVNASPVCSQSPALVSSPMLSAQSSISKEQGLSSSLLSPQSPSAFTFGSVTQEVLHNRPLCIGESSHPGPSSIDTELSLLNDMQNLDLCNSSSRRSRMYSEDPFPGSVPAPRQAQGMAEEFPHLDMINYLLDDEHSMGRRTMANADFSSPNNVHHHQLSRQYTFPGDMAMSAEMSPAINYCRYDRPTSYHDEGVRWMRGSSSADFDGMGYAVPQVGPSGFGNGQIDGAMHNQWPGGASQFSLPRMRNAEGDVYPYQMPQYANQSCGVDNYTIFEPSSGH